MFNRWIIYTVLCVLLEKCNHVKNTLITYIIHFPNILCAILHAVIFEKMKSLMTIPGYCSATPSHQIKIQV